MKTHIAVALLALHLALSVAAPQNNAVVEESEQKTASVVADKQKGDLSNLETYQNDEMIRACNGMQCMLMNAGQAKALEAGSLSAVYRLTGDAALTKALTPTVNIAMDSVKALDEQTARLEALQQQMESLSQYFNKGEQAAANAKGSFAESITKGVNLPAAPAPKAYAAALPPSKGGFAAAPSKGYSAASSMQLEAAMCPMTMYELGKTQKLYAESRAQMQSANSMNAVLMSEKVALQNQNAVLKVGKQKAEEQAVFNAKYAAEQKARADALTAALAQANAENVALRADKAALENNLAQTQAALLTEKQKTASLTQLLNDCNEAKAVLEQEKAALTDELKETKEKLRQTERDLEMEQNAHARTRRELDATQRELEATEAARKQLEEAKQLLEDELVETKDQLETMTAERDQLQVTLDATSAQLATCNDEKMQCNVALSQEKTLTAQLTSQLANAMALLKEEKKTREELTALLMDVKATAEKLQAEVAKLQYENVQLRTQLMKLQSEQQTALAMAAGCPPTYEKFGLSCYKYVREKTKWKMAQEQCMKDGGNLVSVETRNEQAFLVDYLKRHGAESDTYALTGGNKQMNHWKWLGSSEQYIGQTGPQYWFTEYTKNKSGYDCQGFYLRDPAQYGKWVGLPCNTAAAYTCEYRIAPPGTAAPANAAESMAMYEMFKEAPVYLANQMYSKGAIRFAPPPSKGAVVPLSLAMASKGAYRLY